MEDAKCERGSGIVVRSILRTEHLNSSKTLSHISVLFHVIFDYKPTGCSQHLHAFASQGVFHTRMQKCLNYSQTVLDIYN